MKKILAMVLALGLMLGGCGNAEPEKAPAEGQLEKPGAITAIHPMPEPVISRYESEQKTDSEDEDRRLRMESYLPEIYLPGNPQVTDLINQDLQRVARRFWQGDPEHPDIDPGYAGYLALAQQQYDENPEGFQPWSLSLESRVQQISPRLMTCSFLEDIYQGGPYSHCRYQSLVYDLETGARLTLDDLAAESLAFRNFLSAAVVEQANTSKEIQAQIAWYGPEEYDEILPELIREGGWTLDDNGITIFSQEEELGPHAAGSVSFPISYNRLQSLLKEEYLPVRAEKPEGSISVAAPEGCNARILDDLVLDEAGQILIISAKGRVDHVAVSEAIYLGEEGFVRSHTLWEADYLEDCALRLQAVLSEAAPNLMLTYEDGSGPHSYLLAQSGRDGSYFLMDP